ncbi:hypothetical protein DL764_000488 [Monosporascus ibericus]|uniref:Uncharacterized protein n=1 Tax=Monosporascus ibericus TaxID=155417 RepID=A0A4Q4TV36_9PEZI|nr:hypothetical protein DL764_000488 [Monosporascus ibericus]
MSALCKPQNRPRGGSKAYEASITNLDAGGKVEWGFCASLRKGHSPEPYDKAVGRDMNPHNREIILRERETHGLVYGIDEVDDDLLAPIRADEGVEQVNQVQKGGFAGYATRNVALPQDVAESTEWLEKRRPFPST